MKCLQTEEAIDLLATKACRMAKYGEWWCYSGLPVVLVADFDPLKKPEHSHMCLQAWKDQHPDRDYQQDEEPEASLPYGTMLEDGASKKISRHTDPNYAACAGLCTQLLGESVHILNGPRGEDPS